METIFKEQTIETGGESGRALKSQIFTKHFVKVDETKAKYNYYKKNVTNTKWEMAMESITSI